MISHMSKKVVLLSCLISGIIIGAEKLGQSNYHVTLIKDKEPRTQQRIHTLMFFRKGDYDNVLFKVDFERSVKSTNWDSVNHGVLNVHFKDGTNLEIDVNKHLKYE